MFNTPLSGAVTLALALAASSFTSQAQQTGTNEADMRLNTDLTQMRATVQQAQPMPLGGCNAGYSWHTTYGGCRQAKTETETASCPSDYTGTRTRTRMAYVLQADSGNVAYGSWGDWQESCVYNPPRKRASGVLDLVIAHATGAETGDDQADFISATGGITALGRYPTIQSEMQTGFATRYGVTIYRPNAALNCIYSSGTTPSGGESSATVWNFGIAQPGQSVSKGNAGSCVLSNSNRTATLDGDDGQTTVTVVSSTDCTVVTETSSRAGTRRNSYDICE